MVGNLLAGKGIVKADSGNKKRKGIVRAGSGNRKGKRIVRAGYEKKLGFLIPPYPLTNLELERVYENERKFIGVLSRDNMPKK